jgi:Carboxypeptidase regulatory-like domain
MRMARHSILGFVLLALLTPAIASSQTLGSSIIGVVKDQTGAVLPGVSVEVSSPVLIGGVQTVVSNSVGEYRIVDLRPGQYTLNFKLEGFQTVRHEGIALSASFTATINVEMSTSTVSESITVTGESPLVDVRTNVSDRSINQALLENVPNARGIFAVVSLVPGIAINSPDVGGSQTHQSPRLSTRM